MEEEYPHATIVCFEIANERMPSFFLLFDGRIFDICFVFEGPSISTKQMELSSEPVTKNLFDLSYLIAVTGAW